MTTEATNVVGGVDTDYGAAVDQQGRLLSFQELRATDCGSPTLLAWMRGHGQIWVIGAESARSFGATLTSGTDSGLVSGWWR